jgi:hypothetical protein
MTRDTYTVRVGSPGRPPAKGVQDETVRGIQADDHVNAAMQAGQRCQRIGWVVWRVYNETAGFTEYERTG